MKITHVSEYMYNFYWNTNPLVNSPQKNLDYFNSIFKKNLSKIEDSALFEELDNEFIIDSKWVNQLALKTQIVFKNSKIDISHGYLLYFLVRNYIKRSNLPYINILEVGTARGFSSICMAKALEDHQIDGKIITFDVLPHLKKIFWNTIDDHLIGKQTRNELLKNWKALCERYIIFIQGYSCYQLKKVISQRIHFAFVDGAHNYKDVLIELNHITQFQKKNDQIFCDDYNEILFSGVIKAINEFRKKHNYNFKIIKTNQDRKYCVLTKL